MERGFKRIRPLEGGLDGWADKGYLLDDETLVAIRLPR
jgi:rhodanese-related sulfurtransferase